jgi:hypothetical protein
MMLNHTPPPSDDRADQPADDTPRLSETRYSATDRGPDVAEQAAEVAAAVADLEAAEVAADVAGQTTRRQVGTLQIVMLALLAVSLLIHALTLAELFRVRNTLRAEIDRLATSVDAARSQQIRYDLPIDQQIPIDLDVPIKRSLTIPIQTQVRIQQQINLPVDTGVVGTINIPVPIDATVPISTSVPIDFDQTVNISTTVPLRLNVPVQIDLGSPQIAGYLDRLHDALLKLRDQL